MADRHVTVDDLDLEATWTDDTPETRAALEDTLPVAGDGVRWGDELYFDVSLDVASENAREAVPEGAIAYWPAGGKLCLFWGPTPASDARTSIRRAVTEGTASTTNRAPQPP